MNSLWIDFVNSDWHDALGRDPDRDRLAEAEWVRRLIEDHGLPPFDPRTRRAQAALHELRDLLVRLVRTLVEQGRLHAEDLDRLNAYLAARPVTSRLEVAGDECRVRLDPTAKGLDAALFMIVESFTTFVVEGEPDRLKLCENPDCRWVFYDTTRSRTRRWCADSCGNLMKVRKFRDRKRAGKKPAGKRPGRR